MLCKHLGCIHLREVVVKALLHGLHALARVQICAVCGNGDEHIVRTKAKQLRGLDCGNGVADSRETKVWQGVDYFLWNVLTLHQVVTTSRGIEQHVEFIGYTIGNRSDDVGVHHVMNEWNVLVADALNVVLAETVLEHGWALKRFNGNDLGSVLIFQMVARTNSSCRTGCASESSESQVWTVQAFSNMFVHS